MAKGVTRKKIIFFALPLFLGNLFQQLYNTADSLTVGDLPGSNALAAASSSGDLIFLMVGSSNGIAIGAGTVIAHHSRARDIDNMQWATHTTVAFGLAPSLVLTVPGVLLAPQILIWMDTPASALPQPITYFRIYSIGPLGFVIYNIFVGILQAVGDSRHPLDYLIISSTINIVLDIILIIVSHTGVGSAASATILSQSVSAFLRMNRLLRTKDSYRPSLCKIRLYKNILALIIRHGLLNGLQNPITAITNVVVQFNINGFGEMAMTECGAYSKTEGFAFLPITSFTMAPTTFVGQNLGVRQYERTKKDAKFGMLCSMAIAEMIEIVIFLEVSLLTAVSNNDSQVVMFGTGRARTSAIFFFLLAYLHYISTILRGVGKPMVPTIAILLFWCVVRVTFLTVMIHLLNDIAVVYWVYPLTWSLSSTTFFLYYRKMNWMYASEVAQGTHTHVSNRKACMCVIVAMTFSLVVGQESRYSSFISKRLQKTLQIRA